MENVVTILLVLAVWFGFPFIAAKQGWFKEWSNRRLAYMSVLLSYPIPWCRAMSYLSQWGALSGLGPLGVLLFTVVTLPIYLFIWAPPLVGIVGSLRQKR